MLNAIRRFEPLIAMLLFLTGAGIYLLFRAKCHFGFYVLEAVGVGEWVDALRKSVSTCHPSEFVRFCLPDGLWSTSYILTADYIFSKESKHVRMLWAAAIPFLGGLSELLQAAGILPGVFDPWDVVCYSLPYIIYFSITIKNKYNDVKQISYLRFHYHRILYSKRHLYRSLWR